MASLPVSFYALSSFLSTFFFVIFTNYKLVAASHYEFVTCGSVLKLMNTNFNMRLHSHDVKYGSGSGQQSVTGTDEQDDINSHWVVKGKSLNSCIRGVPIKCGDEIRLEHLSTGRNLHSHHFPSPLSNNQEVSAFGENGEGDTGDFWKIMCQGDYWERDDPVRFKHIDTDGWLSISGNKFGRPITGQMEVIATNYPDNTCYWKSAEGVFVKPTEVLRTDSHFEHQEL